MIGSFGRNVATTALSSIGVTVTAGFAGLVIARAMGPATRGEYAAILAWFGIAAALGQIGQGAAITYFVAGDHGNARNYLATSRRISLAGGSVVVLLGFLAAPMISGGSSRLLTAYQAMFLVCLISFATAGYVFALQATDNTHWNIARLTQPALFAVAIVVLHATGRLTLASALSSVAATLVLQALIASRLCARHGLTGGRAAIGLSPALARYGGAHFFSSAPAELISRLDVLVLSMAVAPAALGHYAVASSLTALAMPAVSAVGYVAFPRIAARRSDVDSSESFQRRIIITSAIGSGAIMASLVLLAPWFVPLVFGDGYQQAVTLVSYLAPAGMFLACGQVAGDILRGRGQPMAVARAQWTAAAVTTVLMAVLVPIIGVAGAAIATGTAAGTALLLMIRTILRPVHPVIAVSVDTVRPRDGAEQQPDSLIGRA